MFSPHPAPDASEPALDPSVAGDLAMLDHLARRGLAQADAVKADGSTASAHAFDKHSRAVRLTIMLKATLRAGPAAWIPAAAWRARRAAKVPAAQASAEPGAEGPATGPGSEPADTYAALKTGKKARVRELLRDVIDRETTDPEEADTLGDALDERLLYDDAYDDIEGLPLRDVVEHMCADLQLKPDWRRWTGEGWKPNPPFYRPLCSAFRTPSRTPILNDLPDDDPDPDPLE